MSIEGRLQASWIVRLGTVFVLTTGVACTDNTPTTSSAAPSHDGTDPRCSDLLYEVPASCRTCEQEECCTAIMRCQGSPDCETFHSCVADCPPSRREECEDRCAQTQSDITKGLYYTMRTCLDSAVRCSDVCLLPDAGVDAAIDGGADGQPATDGSAATP